VNEIILQARYPGPADTALRFASTAPQRVIGA
jgi:hypothetical protein